MDIKTVKSLIEAIQKKTGHQASTVCQKALGNPPFYERLNKREQDLQSAYDRLKAFESTLPVTGHSNSPSSDAPVVGAN